MASFDDEEEKRKALESRIRKFRESEEKPGLFSVWQGLYLVGSLGFAVAVSIIIGIGLGVYLDGRLHTKPWFTLGGLGLGLAAAAKTGYELIRQSLNKKE